MKYKTLDDMYRDVFTQKGISVVDLDSRYEPGDEPDEVDVHTGFDGEQVYKRKCWRDKNGELHRINGPAVVLKDITDSYIDYDDLSGENVIVPESVFSVECWFIHGVRHRLNGPAYIRTDTSTNTTFTSWFKNGQLHRDGDKPAVIEKTPRNNYYRWFTNNICIKSIETGRGGICYYNGKHELHREDGPAVVERMLSSLFVKWYKNGKKHRVDGPALYMVDRDNGRIRNEEFWVDGKPYTKEKYNEFFRGADTKVDRDVLSDLKIDFE